MTTLYRKNANSIGTWRIWPEGAIIHIAHATVMGGSEVRHTELVDSGKQGRSLDEQVASRIRSRVSRMMDRGYKTSLSDAQSSSSNQLGLARPMLAQPWKRVGMVDMANAVLQKKLNGHRCLATMQEDELIAYSRQGKQITQITHILKELRDRLPEGTTVDGELYVHGVKLQTLSSWIKREQPDTYRLKYVVYDTISPDSYRDRHAEISDLFKGCEHVLVLPYEPFQGSDHMIRRRDEVIKVGFEGLMLRLHGRGYDTGNRSTSLIKVKKFEDAEFKVLDIVPSSEGWGICICELPNGKTFRTSAPGTKEEKLEALENKVFYVGRMLTVEYAELTDDGIPFHCSATGWREDI